VAWLVIFPVMKLYSLMLLSLLCSISLLACSSDDEAEATATTTTGASTEGATDGVESTAGESTAGDTDGGTAEGTGDDSGGTEGGTGPLADLCSDCDNDGDCGAGGSCVKDARGETFCSRKCGYFGESACPDEYYCKQLGTSSNDFYCTPLDGICERDGQDCSPCRPGQDDCETGLFCLEPLGGIGFCVRNCEGAGTCPFSGTECGHHESVEGSICLPKIDGVPTAKCGARPLNFCEPCSTQGQCSTGICVESGNIGQVCSKPCDGNNDCPSGTDCVQGNCVPPIAHGCQGFLSCLGVDCLGDEICHKGFCIDAP
jgi:hypothetical protein